MNCSKLVIIIDSKDSCFELSLVHMIDEAMGRYPDRELFYDRCGTGPLKGIGCQACRGLKNINNTQN